ncbi:MAG: hypothetical protein ACRDF4_01465, partial [Rhabdochlamydiaceae bacterium]
VCSYDMGAGIADYRALCKYLDPQFTLDPKNKEQQDSFLKQHQKSQENVTRTLEDQAQVYCLQQVLDAKGPLIQTLKERKFEILHCPSNSPGCAVALDPTCFDSIQNHSQMTEKGDVAIAIATHRASHQQMTFASIYASRCTLEGVVDALDAAHGDSYCSDVVELFSQIPSAPFQFIGASMNANPEKWNPRFHLFEEKGFTTLRTNKMTNVMPQSPTYKEREIDFIFTRTSPQKKSHSNLPSPFQATLFPVSVLNLDPACNASNHLPLIATISIPKKLFG